MDTNERERKAILSILSTALFGNTLELPDHLNWDALFQESIAQAVFPLVFQTTRKLLPEDFKQKWEGTFLKILASNVRVNAAHASLHRLLTEHDIPYVILKGCASAKYYPAPELRAMGDVDFLVDPKDLDRCAELFEAVGMRRGDDGKHEYHREYYLHSIEYEMHWSPPGISAADSEKIRPYYEDIFQQSYFADVSSGSCCFPSDFHHGLTMLLHTTAHMTTTGIGLRHLCDWAVFVERFSDKAFCECFEACLKDIGLWTFAKILTMTSTCFLGGSPKSWAAGINKELAANLMDDTWYGGNFGKKDPQRFSYAALMIDRETRKIENRGIIKALFATVHRKAKIYYPGLTSSIVLRPIAWAAICVKYSWRILTRKRPWMRFGKDTKIAEGRRELFKQLKLFED